MDNLRPNKIYRVAVASRLVCTRNIPDTRKGVGYFSYPFRRPLPAILKIDLSLIPSQHITRNNLIGTDTHPTCSISIGAASSQPVACVLGTHTIDRQTDRQCEQNNNTRNSAQWPFVVNILWSSPSPIVVVYIILYFAHQRRSSPHSIHHKHTPILSTTRKGTRHTVDVVFPERHGRQCLAFGVPQEGSCELFSAPVA